MLSPYMQKRQGMKNGTEKTAQEERAETVTISIKKATPVRKEENKEYIKEAKKYLAKHVGCEAHVASGCTGLSKEIHHKRKRRTKDDRINPEHFLAVCRPCHLWIESHPKASLELGLSEKAID
jgi:hypothetical protein